MPKRHLLHTTYFLNFFFGLHAFSVLYVHSSLLSNAIGERFVGLVYALAALSAICVLRIVPTILRDVGDVRFTFICIVLEILAVFGLAISASPLLIVILFILHTIAARALLMDLDIFLESASTDDTTGVVRGTFLTVGNIALVIAPVLVGLLLGGGENYSRVYLFSAAILLPAALLIALSFRHFKDPRYTHIHFRQTFKKIWARRMLRKSLMIDWLLRFFYAWMVIYMPLYLHNYIGLPWDRIGVIFTIMLIPFALFELPLGALADKVYGEKELLIIGLCIMAGTTLVLPFIHSTSFLIWTIALFSTRVGASMVEIMSETYFFKQVHQNDADIIGFFRSVEPIAYVIAPLLASLVLFVAPLHVLFILLGFIVMAGIPVAATLRDTL